MANNAGVLQWANNIRFAMANDPARQKVKDEIDFRGFRYLDELDAQIQAILTGPTEDFGLELLRTPARKRVTSHKLKATPSRLRNGTTLEDTKASKENSLPVNTFQNALLAAKAKGERRSVTDMKVLSPSRVTQNQGLGIHVLNNDENAMSRQLQEEISVNVLESSPPPSVSLPSNVEGNPNAMVLDEPAFTQSTDLSAIAEDDEPAERSIVSEHGACRGSGGVKYSIMGSGITEQKGSIPVEPKTESLHNESLHFARSSQSDFQFPAGSPSFIEEQSSQLNAKSTERLSSKAAANLYQEMENSADDSSPEIWPSVEGVTVPLVEMPSLKPDEAATEQPSMKAKDATGEPPSPSAETRPSTAAFPLPEPMPLRKSMRAPREPSVGATLTGTTPTQTAVPSQPPMSKRTSWLTRAKETRALEAPAFKSGASHPGLQDVEPTSADANNALKRKSEALVDDSESRTSLIRNRETTGSRPSKVAKMDGSTSTPRENNFVTPEPSPTTDAFEDQEEGTGVLDQLRSTMARMGKSMGRSLGGAAANEALAEARAAAEAKLAQRGADTEETPKAELQAAAADQPQNDMLVDKLVPIAPTLQPENKEPPFTRPVFTAPPPTDDRRLSLSDLVTSRESTGKDKGAPGLVFAPPKDAQSKQKSAFNQDDVPHRPVFTRPEPVFVPPPKASPPPSPPQHAINRGFNLSPSSSSRIAAMSLGLGPRIPSPSEQRKKAPLTAQSTLESMESDQIFDGRDDVPAWMPSTQDTEYSFYESQERKMITDDLDDDDDSWPKQTVNVRYESATWSSAPDESHRAEQDVGQTDTAFVVDGEINDNINTSPYKGEIPQHSRSVPGAFEHMDVDDSYEGDGEPGSDDAVILNPIRATDIKLVDSQTSLVSSKGSQVDSQGNGGILTQAGKFMANVFGATKKPKLEQLKSLQSAEKAKKMQEEALAKKEARMKEMENRRQAALLRKAEEEKARAAEEERKVREENERRKKEREELNEKRNLKTTSIKKDDDTIKKRLELQKKASKPNLKPGPAVAGGSKSVTLAPKVPAKPLNASTSMNQTSSLNKSTSKLPASSSSLKGKGKAPPMVPPKTQDDELSQPSQLLQTQMAARAKAQLQAAKQGGQTLPPTDNIELPDVNSEYEYSDDEDAKPKILASWAEKEEVERQLRLQSTWNPDDIFGQVRPVKMEEIFRTRSSKFRARTSSANWSGADRLTVDEEEEYARRMGFQ